MDRFIAMRAFVEVVESGSFTQAAIRLEMSKSQISKLMTALEGHLGSRLLQRTTRSISLTESGSRYLGSVKAILVALNEAEEEAQDLGRVPMGRLRVSAPVSYGVRRLSPLLPAFHKAYPDIHLDLDLNDRFVDLVQDGLDLALRVGVPQDSSLKQKLLAKDEIILVASPEFLKTAGPIEHPDDLSGVPCLSYSHSNSWRHWRFNHAGQGSVDVEVSGPLTTNNGDLILRATLDGMGVSRMPAFFSEEAVASGALVPLLADWNQELLSITAVYPEGRHLSRKARVFIDFLGQELS